MSAGATDHFQQAKAASSLADSFNEPDDPRMEYALLDYHKPVCLRLRDGPTDNRPKLIADLATAVPVERVGSPHLADTDGDHDHDRADHKYGHPTAFDAMARAHFVRLLKGYTSETALECYLRREQFLALELGLTDGVPDQSTLWRAWEHRFTERFREFLELCAAYANKMLQKYGVSMPDPALDATEADGRDYSTREQLEKRETRRVWQAIKPIVQDTIQFDRADNASIPMTAFHELQTYGACRSDANTPSSADNAFDEDSSRYRTPDGDTLLHHAGDMDRETTRRMFQEAVRTMVARARANDELTDEVLVSIDITKGPEFYGDRGGLESDIPGYKGGSYHFQYGVIKVVGLDVPIILDVVPITKPYRTHQVVEQLLSTATDILPSVSTVLMDREFDNERVESVVRQHDCYYVIPQSKRSSQDHTTRVRQIQANGGGITVDSDMKVDGSAESIVYVPVRSDDSTMGVKPERADDLPEFEDDDLYEEGLEAFGIDPDDLGDTRMFEDVLDDVREDQSEPRSEAGGLPMVPFKTNHPILVDCDDESDKTHAAARLMRWYGYRWGIENGFKQLKTFLFRTYSKNPNTRFWNFCWSCLLYNAWRLVDMLVQASLDEAVAYEPTIKASDFLTYAKNYFEIDPGG